MHKAIKKLNTTPELLLIDGNRFNPYPNIKHECIIKGDGKFMAIAAASVLAKVYRDKLLLKMHDEFPNYNWNNNKGYPTKTHRAAIFKHGETKYHRKTFKLLSDEQLALKL